MQQPNMPNIVTKQSLARMLNEADDKKKIEIVGRALVALFERQTEAEKSADTTSSDNNVGFSSSDARSGCLTAKSYLRNKTLAQWQVDKWLAPQRNGLPRICRYDRQLNEIAEEKARKAAAAAQRQLALAA